MLVSSIEYIDFHIIELLSCNTFFEIQQLFTQELHAQIFSQ